MKKISTIIGILIINILTIGIVFAASTFQVDLKANKSELKAGETVTISISLKDLNVTTGEQGIGAYLAKIEYDKSLFENAVFSGYKNWEGSMENGNIVGVTTNGKVVKQDETIATLSLTVKENAKAGNTKITISNFVGSDAVNDISTNDKSINIKVVEENKNQNQGNSQDSSNKNETNIENNTNTESNVTDDENTNSDESNNTNNDTSDNTTSDNDSNDDIDTETTDTPSDEQISQEKNNMWLYGIFIIIILILIIAIYIYYKNKNTN